MQYNCFAQKLILKFRAEAIYIGLVLAVFYGVIGTQATANEFHAHKDIRFAAETFFRHHLEQSKTENFEIHVSNLDPRLKLSQCDTPLEAFLPPGAKLYGKTTAGVRCTGSQPWKIFVPVKLTLYEDVLAVSRTIVKGETLAPADLTVVSQEVGYASQTHFRDLRQVVGFIAKRAIPAGKILTAHMVQAPRLVRAGQEVILLAITPQIEVRMKGKALSDGAKGDVIHVRNLRSKRVVQGVVTHSGIVEVNM